MEQIIKVAFPLCLFSVSIQPGCNRAEAERDRRTNPDGNEILWEACPAAKCITYRCDTGCWNFRADWITGCGQHISQSYAAAAGPDNRARLGIVIGRQTTARYAGHRIGNLIITL